MRNNAGFPAAIFRFFLASLLVAVFAVSLRPGQSQPGASDFSALDSILQSAIEHDEIPGAVLLVEHRGKIVYQKARESRALVPVARGDDGGHDF